MFSDNIEGIEELRSRIPNDLQSWGYFSDVEEVHFYSDYNELGLEIQCLDLTLSHQGNPRIKIILHLQNIYGKVAFLTGKGFYSGLTIDDLSGNGYERGSRFHLYSSEMDIDPDIYCEKISVELV